MNYFDKLIRRLSGSQYGYMLSPELCLRDAIYDPFENTAVLPLSYPNTVKRPPQQQESSAAAVSKTHPVLNNKTSSQKNITEFSSGRVREERIVLAKRPLSTITPDPKIRDYQKTTPENIAPKITQRTQQQNAAPPGIARSTPLPATPHNSIYKRNAIELQQEGGTKLTKTIAAAPLAEKIINDNRIDMPALKTEPLRRCFIRSEVIEKNTAASPLSVAAKSQTIGKRKNRKPKEAAPKLMIGRMKVDVVPLKQQADASRQSARVAAAESRSVQGSENNAQTQKLSFGLGQM